MLEKFKLKLKFSKDWNFREKISDERVNSPQSARQKSPTALKRLDISIKYASKMAHQFCRFCAIQQKQPMTSFCHGLMSRCDKKDTRLHALTKFEAEKISLQMAMSIIWCR